MATYEPERTRNFYLLGDSQAEMVQLIATDQLFTRAMGGLLPEQPEQTIAQLHDVLDIGCGPGGWVLEMAYANPRLQARGIDVSQGMIDYANGLARANGLDNAQFHVANAIDPLDFPDGTFDLVNARYITGLLEAAAWPNALEEFVRVTRPAGVIRISENDLPISNTVAFAHLGGLISDALYETKRSFSSNGQLLSVTPALKRLLQDAGSQEVQQGVWFINFSAGKPAHADLCQRLSETYRLAQPFLIRTGVATPEAVEQTYQQMLSEMQSDDFCAGAFSLTVWGTKP